MHKTFTVENGLKKCLSRP